MKNYNDKRIADTGTRGETRLALEIAKLAEQKAREMSELAEAIAQKYYNRLLEAAKAAEKKREN